MKIKLATIHDLDKIAPLFDQYRQFYKRESDLTAAKAFLHNRLQNKESVIFLAQANDFESRGEAIGFVQMYPSFSSISMQKLWILNDLFVATKARKKSVGEHLIKAAEEFAIKDGARGLTLKTAKDNSIAQSLYTKLNWMRDELFYSYNRIFEKN